MTTSTNHCRPSINLTHPKHCIIIGGGFGGIASALRCRAMGFQVTLIERLQNLGGRAQVFEVNGFKHDAGPTIITAPFLMEELFQLFNENLYNNVTFRHLTPWYRYVFHDGRILNYGSDLDKLKSEISTFSKADVKGYEKLLSSSKAIYQVGFENLADQPFTNFFSMIKLVPSLISLRADRSVSQLVKKHIKHPLLQRAFSIHPLLVGGNPFSTTSIYSLIHYLERKWGVYFCMGGTGALVSALENLMERQDIKIIKGVEVKDIITEKDNVSGVRLSNNQILASDLVVCNADPPTVYKEMIEYNGVFKGRTKIFTPEKWTKYSMGLFVFYFGTFRKYPDVAHHTIWLGERFRSLLNDIFEKGILTEDFSIYLHRPTATDPSFAPDGCDSFYALCPVPNLQTPINWPVEGEKLKDRIIDALSKTILPGLREHITAEFWMDPRQFKRDYRAHHGAGFSIAPSLSQSAWFRYHNRDPHIQNLYFVGAGTHPGAGLPGVISSAKVVENLLRNEFK